MPLWARLELSQILGPLAQYHLDPTASAEMRGSAWKPKATEPTCHRPFVRRTTLGAGAYNPDVFGQPWAVDCTRLACTNPREERAVRQAILEYTNGGQTLDEMWDAGYDERGELKYGFPFPLTTPPLNEW